MDRSAADRGATAKSPDFSHRSISRSPATRVPTRTFVLSLIDEAYPGEVRRETIAAPDEACALVRARHIFARAHILQIKAVAAPVTASKTATRAALARQPIARFIGGEFKAFDCTDEVTLFDLSHAE